MVTYEQFIASLKGEAVCFIDVVAEQLEMLHGMVPDPEYYRIPKLASVSYKIKNIRKSLHERAADKIEEQLEV